MTRSAQLGQRLGQDGGASPGILPAGEGFPRLAGAARSVVPRRRERTSLETHLGQCAQGMGEAPAPAVLVEMGDDLRQQRLSRRSVRCQIGELDQGLDGELRIPGERQYLLQRCDECLQASRRLDVGYLFGRACAQLARSLRVVSDLGEQAQRTSHIREAVGAGARSGHARFEQGAEQQLFARSERGACIEQRDHAVGPAPGQGLARTGFVIGARLRCQRAAEPVGAILGGAILGEPGAERVRLPCRADTPRAGARRAPCAPPARP